MKAKLIAHSRQMQEVLKETEIIRTSVCPVLIIGETGSGKEILADYIHSRSPRSAGRFVKVSLSALPDSLFESELFGHEKGAFTGADKSQTGFFEAAHNATIFLDDIDDFPMPLQPKLLRVIENKELIRLGSNNPVHNDARIITSSKVELKEHVDRGNFRSDLFYRLSVFRLFIPPLRERRDDIIPLLEHFINNSPTNNNNNLDIRLIKKHLLFDYDWVGNVRELRNFAEKLTLYPPAEVYSNFENIFYKFIQSNSPGNKNNIILKTEENNKEIQSAIINQTYVETDDSFDNLVENFEITLIINALKKSFGNVNLAARLLKLKSSTLRDKVKNTK